MNAVGIQRTLQNSLKQTMRSDFDADGIGRDMLGSFFKQYRVKQVLSVIFCGTVLGYISFPFLFQSRSADPFGGTQLGFFDNLE